MTSSSNVTRERVAWDEGETYVRCVLPLSVEEVLESQIGQTMYKLHAAVLTGEGKQCQKLAIAFWDKGDGRGEFVQSLVGADCRIEFRAERRGTHKNYWLDEIDRLVDDPCDEPHELERTVEFDDAPRIVVAAALAVVEAVRNVPTASAITLIANRLGAADELLQLLVAEHPSQVSRNDATSDDPADIPFS